MYPLHYFGTILMKYLTYIYDHVKTGVCRHIPVCDTALYEVVSDPLCNHCY